MKNSLIKMLNGTMEDLRNAIDTLGDEYNDKSARLEDKANAYFCGMELIVLLKQVEAVRANLLNNGIE